MSLNKIASGASLSFLAVALMVLTAFATMPSTYIAGNEALADDNTLAGKAGDVRGALNADAVDSALAELMKGSKGPFQVYVVTDDREAANDVLASIGQKTMKGAVYAGLPTVELMELDTKTINALAESGTVTKILAYEKPVTDPARTELAKEDFSFENAPSVEDYDVDVVHGAVDAWANGWTGEGVRIAVIDDGFDMAHPDMQGQQARYESGPYAGWPIGYDDYAAGRWADQKIGGWLADTSTEVKAKNRKGGSVTFDGVVYAIKGIMDADGNVVRSKSGIYHMGYHPDPLLAGIWGAPVAVLVVDTKVSGVYDTVYVDVMYDLSFANDKPCTKGDEISYFDFYDATTGLTDTSMWNAGDGFADYSGGMAYWIADGVNVYPASDWAYGATWTAGSGDAVAFMGAYAGSHGTMTSSSALAVGRTMGGQLGGMAPDAKLICIPFTGSTINAWKFAQWGADGVPGTGDEADICTNSYGWSATAIDAGYEILDMIATKISLSSPTMWFWSAGNGGPGYGTTHSVTDFTSTHVGAGTTMQYRYIMGYELAPGYQKWGDVIPFSCNGPGRNGKFSSEIVASGAYSLEPCPLNMADNNGLIGDGSVHWQIGSGTSHATPTTAGGTALGFQAYYITNGEFPAKDYAKAMLLAAADDMHFDPFRQGAGWLNAGTFADLMSGAEGVASVTQGPNFLTTELYPGDVYGTKYEMFPNFMLPGQTDESLTVTTTNFGVEDKEVSVSSKLLLKTGDVRLSTRTVGHTEKYIDITSLVPEGTQLLKATMYIPIEQFDPELDSVANFEYWLELHDWVDLNGNGQLDAQVKSPSVWELFRFTVDGEQTNYNQVMIKDPLERITDGLILRVRPYVPLPNVEVNIQLDFYTLQEFPWVKVRQSADDAFSSEMTIEVAAGESTSWQVQVAVPADAIVGTYGAAVYIDDGSRVQCMPVMINVPATDYEFEFGGESYFDTPYNNNIVGLADRLWRFEVGDWRIYWCLPTEAAPENGYLMAGVEWTELPTDINVHMLAPMAVDADDAYQALFSEYGPGYYMTPIASSDERYMGAGIFGYYTNTGEAKEVIAGALAAYENALSAPAPFAVLTRCPLMAGHDPYDTPTGFTKWVVMNGYGAGASEVTIDLSDGDPVSGSITAWFDIAVDGLVPVEAGGESPMIKYFWPEEAIYQDLLSADFEADLAGAPYTKVLAIANCDKLTVSVAEVSGCPDIDMGVWYDANMDGIADMTEPYWYVGAGGSSETLTLYDLADGQYLVKVLGYTVTGEPGYFSLTVLQSVAGASVNAVIGDSTVGSGFYAFEIVYAMPAVEGEYVGSGTFGFEGTDNMFGIPITFKVTA